MPGCVIVLVDAHTRSPTYVGGNQTAPIVLAALERTRIGGASMTLWRAYHENRIVVERDWRRRVMTEPALAPMRPFVEHQELEDLAAIPLPWQDVPLGVICGLLPLDTPLAPDTFAHWRRVAFEAALALRYASAIRGARHVGTDHERLRLREELHDTVSQRLFGLSVLTARAEADARNTGRPGLSAQLTELRTLVAEASADIRLLMGDPPRTVAGDRLSARLSLLVNTFGPPNGLAIGLELAPCWDDLSADCTADVTRVVRECLRNVVKHARATEVAIRVPATADGTLLVEVADNGAGFDPRAVGQTSFGLGLINERARDRGGSCEVQVGDEGTTMRVRLVPEYESDWQLARRALDAQAWPESGPVR